MAIDFDEMVEKVEDALARQSTALIGANTRDYGQGLCPDGVEDAFRYFFHDEDGCICNIIMAHVAVDLGYAPMAGTSLQEGFVCTVDGGQGLFVGDEINRYNVNESGAAEQLLAELMGLV